MDVLELTHEGVRNVWGLYATGDLTLKPAGIILLQFRGIHCFIIGKL